MNYEEKIRLAKEALNSGSYDKETIEYIFPELVESEDERIRGAIIDHLKDNNLTEWAAWLEKQVHVDKDEIVKGIRRGVAISLINYIDANSKGMCLSNMECEGIENAIVNEDWDKVYSYMKKKLEKQGEQKVPVAEFKAKDWYVSKVDGKIYNAKFMEKTPTNQARRLEIEKAAMSATGIIEQEEWFIKGAEWSDKNPSYISSEKQGEQNPGDKVEPKFHKGDWVTDGFCKCQIRFIDDTQYWYSENCILGSIESVDKKYHLWTIQDAKDGDILDANGAPFIYKQHDKDYVYFYCGINLAGTFIEANEIDVWNNNYKVYPATKDQRDILFEGMADAGYTFDFEKKELKEIEIEDEIEIPFGAKDSELQEVTYYIPKGFHAEIDGDKVVIKKGEKSAWSEEDSPYYDDICELLINILHSETADVNKDAIQKDLDWLISLSPQDHWKPTDEQIKALV